MICNICIRNIIVENCTVQFSTVQYSTVQCSAVHTFYCNFKHGNGFPDLKNHGIDMQHAYAEHDCRKLYSPVLYSSIQYSTHML